MSFIRYMLANWRLAFVPKIGVAYRYASEGPFHIGPVLIPREKRQGYVRYEITHTSGAVSEHACEFGVFASMCREAA